MGNFAFATRFGSALAMVGVSVPATAQDVAIRQQSPMIEANQREDRANIRWRATVSDAEFVVVPNVVETRYGW